jgi:hypothetical protein
MEVDSMKNPKTAALLSLVYCLLVIGKFAEANKTCGEQGLKAAESESSGENDGGNGGNKGGDGKGSGTTKITKC